MVACCGLPVDGAGIDSRILAGPRRRRVDAFGKSCGVFSRLRNSISFSLDIPANRFLRTDTWEEKPLILGVGGGYDIGIRCKLALF